MPSAACIAAVSSNRRVRETSDEQGLTNIDKLVAAFVRTRGVDNLAGAILTRHWLAADMGVSIERLERILKLMRWRGLVDISDPNIVMVKDDEAMRAIALGEAPDEPEAEPLEMLGDASAVPIAGPYTVWH